VSPQRRVFFVDAARAVQNEVLVSTGAPRDNTDHSEAGILLLRRGETLAYQGPREPDTMRGWLASHVLPLLSEVSALTFEPYRALVGGAHAQVDGTARAPPMFWLMLNATSPQPSALAAVHRARIGQLVRRAAAATGAIFGWLDAEMHAHHMPVGSRLPVLVADRADEHFVYHMPLDRLPGDTALLEGTEAPGDAGTASAAIDVSGSVATTAPSDERSQPKPFVTDDSLPSAEVYHASMYAPLVAWTRAVIAGTVMPTLRSEEPPLDNLAPVVRLVGSTIDPLALRARTDVLLLVHAPWGGERAAVLLEEIDALARLWLHERRLRFASIDVSRNDIPRSLGVASVPALLFLRGDRTEGAPPIDLTQQAASRDDLMALLVEHASFELTRPVDPSELSRLAAMLPRLGEETKRLLEQNRELEAEVAGLQARLAAAERRTMNGATTTA